MEKKKPVAKNLPEEEKEKKHPIVQKVEELKDKVKTVVAQKNIIPEHSKVKKLFSQSPFLKYLKITALAILSVIVLFVLGVGVAIYGFNSKTDFVKRVSRIIPYPAVFVGTSNVSLYEYLDSVYHAKHYYTRTKMEAIADYKEKIRDSLINRQIILLQAKKYGVKVSQEEVNTQLDQEVEQFGGEKKAEEVLLDLYDYRIKDIKKLIYYKMLEDRLREKVPVKVHAWHILIKVDEGAASDVVDAAQKRADDLYQRIKKGEDFATLAKEFSEDTATKDSGGDLGFFEKGQFVQEFEKAAFALKKGETSTPVRTKFGFHIIKVEERKGEVNKTFDEWFKDVKKQTSILRLVKL